MRNNGETVDAKQVSYGIRGRDVDSHKSRRNEPYKLKDTGQHSDKKHRQNVIVIGKLISSLIARPSNSYQIGIK